MTYQTDVDVVEPTAGHVHATVIGWFVLELIVIGLLRILRPAATA